MEDILELLDARNIETQGTKGQIIRISYLRELAAVQE